jgi:hypothetical protein
MPPKRGGAASFAGDLGLGQQFLCRQHVIDMVHEIGDVVDVALMAARIDE